MSRQDTYGKRQVVTATFLTDIGWRKVDGDVGSGWLETDVTHGRTDTVITLLDGCIGQS